MTTQNFSYQAKMQLSHNNFADHPLNRICSGVGVLLESEGFSTYKPCAEALNELANDLIKTLTEQNEGKTFIIAWETNPKDGKASHITPVENWQADEVIKYYVIEETGQPVTLKTLNPMLAASIFSTESHRESYN